MKAEREQVDRMRVNREEEDHRFVDSRKFIQPNISWSKSQDRFLVAGLFITELSGVNQRSIWTSKEERKNTWKSWSSSRGAQTETVHGRQTSTYVQRWLVVTNSWRPASHHGPPRSSEGQTPEELGGWSTNKVNKCCARVLVHQLAAVTISPSLSVYSHQVCFPVRVSISNVFLKTPFVQVVLHATNLLMDRYVSTRFVFVSRSPYLIKKPHPLMGRRAVISYMALNNQTSWSWSEC